MRGIPSLITDIRKKVFTEVARMAYSGGDYTKAEDLPYVIVPGDQPLHRESVFLERAIAGERVRLAMGLPVRSVQTRSLLTEGMDHAAIAQQYYEPPLINIIPYACHACPTNQYKVTENCQNCLAASCQQVCPRDAISFVNGKSHIDPSKCIKCGKCAQACDYNAIIHMERPCQAACGMDAIGADENGKAIINQDKCVSCGQCLVSCPFGAIVDKGQIYQVVRSIVEGNEVYAIAAPAFARQFGKDVTVAKFRAAVQELGFKDLVEVAVGADICTVEEAKDFVEKNAKARRRVEITWVYEDPTCVTYEAVTTDLDSVAWTTTDIACFSKRDGHRVQPSEIFNCDESQIKRLMWQYRGSLPMEVAKAEELYVGDCGFIDGWVIIVGPARGTSGAAYRLRYPEIERWLVPARGEGYLP